MQQNEEPTSDPSSTHTPHLRVGPIPSLPKPHLKLSLAISPAPPRSTATLRGTCFSNVKKADYKLFTQIVVFSCSGIRLFSRFSSFFSFDSSFFFFKSDYSSNCIRSWPGWGLAAAAGWPSALPQTLRASAAWPVGQSNMSLIHLITSMVNKICNLS